MVCNTLTAGRILNEPQGCRFSSVRKIWAPGRSTFSRSSGVRRAKAAILSRAAATCKAVGRARSLEVNDLSNAGRARLLEDIVRRGKILWRDAQRFVERHVKRRASAYLGTVGDLADLAQNVIGRDGAGLQRP